MKKPCRSSSHGQIGVRIFKNLGNMPRLPAREILKNATTNCRSLGESTIEEDEIHRLPVTQEVTEVAGHGRIFGIGEPHFPQPRSGSQRMLPCGY